MPKAVINFDYVVKELAEALQNADTYCHSEPEKFVVSERKDVLEWRIEQVNCSASWEKLIAIIPDTSKTCLEYQLRSRSLDEIAELMGITVADMKRLADEGDDPDDDEIINAFINYLPEYCDRFIRAIGGTVKDYYQEAENLLNSAGYIRTEKRK